MATHMFPVVNAIPGFVSIKIGTVSKVIMDVRRSLQMFETKSTSFEVKKKHKVWNIFKVNNDVVLVSLLLTLNIFYSLF